MNMILSSIVGIVGGACTGVALVTMFGVICETISQHPTNPFTIDDKIRYSALCGAVIGLILVLGSGQRL
jgi:hypothetical protein